jgi:hypothetical protein
MSNLEEYFTFFKNVFSITYKNRQEIINPPKNYDILLTIICIIFNFNEEEIPYLKIYQQNNLINEDNYLNLSNLKDFVIKLNIKNEKDELNSLIKNK